MNKNTILAIVFGILLLIFFGTRFLGSDDDRTLREVLVAVDTATVTKIVLASEIDSAGITLEKTGENWQVVTDTLRDEAGSGPVESILSSLVAMVPDRLIAKSEDRWDRYAVSDSLGTRVRVFAENDLLADIVIGSGNMQQASRTMSTYVRLHDEEEVYAVEGFLSGVFSHDLDRYRDKTFLTVGKGSLTSLRFDYPGDSSFVLRKADGGWQINEAPADSAAVAGYLNSLQRFTPGDFANHFSAEGKTAAYRLSMDGNNMRPVTIEGFRDGENLVLHSSLNDNAYFKTGNLDVFEDLFAPGSSFLNDKAGK